MEDGYVYLDGNTIPQAVTVLLYKSMHMPNEDDAEFADKTKAKPVPENAMKQQMMTMMQQTENLLVQQKQQLARSPRSPRRVEHAAAVNDEYISMVTENTPSVAGSGRRMGPDMFTQDELRVCSRCNLLGFVTARLAGTVIRRAIIADSVVTWHSSVEHLDNRTTATTTAGSS
ncbi:hypothetical protein PI126_g16077 [Phytophthora idaei]|nr:hypothetical protein PI126_g16077 [Phytophthora idaei]